MSAVVEKFKTSVNESADWQSYEANKIYNQNHNKQLSKMAKSDKKQ